MLFNILSLLLVGIVAFFRPVVRKSGLVGSRFSSRVIYLALGVICLVDVTMTYAGGLRSNGGARLMLSLLSGVGIGLLGYAIAFAIETARRARLQRSVRFSRTLTRQDLIDVARSAVEPIQGESFTELYQEASAAAAARVEDETQRLAEARRQETAAAEAKLSERPFITATDGIMSVLTNGVQAIQAQPDPFAETSASSVVVDFATAQAQLESPARKLKGSIRFVPSDKQLELIVRQAVLSAGADLDGDIDIDEFCRAIMQYFADHPTAVQLAFSRSGYFRLSRLGGQIVASYRSAAL